MLFVQVDEWIVDVKIDDGGREGKLHHIGEMEDCTALGIFFSHV